MTKKQKVINSNNIAYQGNVKIQYYRGKKLYKTINGNNSGTLSLFRLLAEALAEAPITGRVPQYISLFKDDTISEDNRTTLVNIPFNDRDVVSLDDSNTSYSIVYKFLIPYTQIVPGTTASKTLALFSSATSVQEPLAIINLSQELTHASNSNILITWELKFSNK